MSTTYSAGRLKITLSEPYPIWVDLGADDDNDWAVRLRHDELADLEYIIQRAMTHARRALPINDKDEV